VYGARRRRLVGEALRVARRRERDRRDEREECGQRDAGGIAESRCTAERARKRSSAHDVASPLTLGQPAAADVPRVYSKIPESTGVQALDGAHASRPAARTIERTSVARGVAS